MTSDQIVNSLDMQKSFQTPKWSWNFIHSSPNTHVSSHVFRIEAKLSHLAWADFKIKVKQIEESTLRFDQWNPLISEM